MSKVDGSPNPGRPAAPAARSTSDNPFQKVSSGRSPRSRPAPEDPKAQVPPGSEEAEMMAAFERIRAAELDEEARRHFSADADALEPRSDPEEHDPNVRVQALDPDEPRKRPNNADSEEDPEPEEPETEDEDPSHPTSVSDPTSPAAGLPGEERLGDPTLLHPDEIRRALGPAVRFAQHAMILADHRMREGQSRGDALAFLMNLYLGLSDREYARRALRDFGPATGILDIYPLELVDQLMVHVPDFFKKAKRAPVFSMERPLRLRAHHAVRLPVQAGLRVRGFALKEGPRPGYLFEPEPEGYKLMVQSTGTFAVMVSAITRDGWLVLDEFLCEVTAGPEDGAPDPFTDRHRSLMDQGPKKSTPKASSEDLSFHFPRRV